MFLAGFYLVRGLSFFSCSFFFQQTEGEIENEKKSIQQLILKSRTRESLRSFVRPLVRP